jgi:exonuclease SbcD
MDFGEQDDHKSVLIVEATAATPADVREVRLSSGRRFRTVKGTLADLQEQADQLGSDEVAGAHGSYLRVIVTDLARAGLADEVRDLFPNAVDVRIEAPTDAREAPHIDRSGRSPRELFVAYLDEKQVDDDRLVTLFDELYEQAGDSGDAGDVAPGTAKTRVDAT